MARVLSFLKLLWGWKSYIINIITPLILAPLFLYDGTEYEQQARCTYVLLMMVIFWTTECLPIAVTAMLPMFLYPLFQITSAKHLAPRYMSVCPKQFSFFFF